MDKKCAHTGCKCMAVPNSQYCSKYCEGKGTTTESSCGCGHPECSTKK
jgi:hypothetical protein